MRPDQPFDQERDLKRKRKEKESQIQKVEEAAKRLKNSTSIHVLAFYLNISSFSLSPSLSSSFPLSFFPELKKKKREEESDKPDTFTEKLAAHLVKNLQVPPLLPPTHPHPHPLLLLVLILLFLLLSQRSKYAMFIFVTKTIKPTRSLRLQLASLSLASN